MKLRGFEWVTAYADRGLALPERKTAGSAGYDLAAATETTLAPQQVTLVPTGLKAYMQQDEYLGIHIRSGLAVKQKLTLVNGQGIIDADYYDNPDNEGHILVAIFNLGTEKVTVKQGERIAQGIFYRYLCVDGDHSEREKAERTGGFGSTGR